MATAKKAVKKSNAKKPVELSVEDRLERLEDEIEHLLTALKPTGIHIQSLATQSAEAISRADEQGVDITDNSANHIIDVVH